MINPRDLNPPTTAAPATPGQLDLDQVEARANAATPGPWHEEHIGTDTCVSIGDYGWVVSGMRAPEYDVDSEQGRDDAEFIAHARTDVPQLVAEVRRLSGQLVERTDRLMETLHKRDELRERLELAEEAADRLRDELVSSPAPGVYQLPAEPAEVTAVWEVRTGDRWQRKPWPFHPDGSPAEPSASWVWERNGLGERQRWPGLLARGPLSTTPPAGTEVSDAD